jgi:protein TonB
MRRKPSVLMLSILVHAAVLFLLATAELWSPISNWPVPHEVLAFSEHQRQVRLDDIELPRAPSARAAGTPAAPSVDTFPELAPVIASSGIAPDSGREPTSGRPGLPGGVETSGGGAIEVIGTTSAPPPPPPPKPQAPIRPYSGIRAPEKIVNVAPIYPPLARASHVQGVVIVEATIDNRGNVESARVLRSIPLLDQAALDAVYQWKFTPTLLNGIAVPIIMTVTVNFKLSE